MRSPEFGKDHIYYQKRFVTGFYLQILKEADAKIEGDTKGGDVEGAGDESDQEPNRKSINLSSYLKC